ncbi:hypothetical protein AVEN_69906-1 [Araneus ventricosus]|uniref:DUF5641 domain-containing protein n=1 Tax=Araneus ventricosus TaxID=182803 RepID=A0A4Y2NSJ5_ARAVE|nr:hypothetical protein AVEN_69906-1 [Araneus ventricosus]
MEVSYLSASKQLPSNNKIIPLTPFYDDSGIIRVGGKLKNSMLTESQKHPILLPKTDHVVNLIITDYHLKLLHAGPQLIQAALREKFWILSARDAVRREVRKCIPCFRNRPKLAEQIMGELPKSTVCPSSVFHRTGLDFAGPFLIRSSKGRGSRNTKCYICVFVCFATKAVHLEVVSDLTSRTFIACLKRFVARRASPHFGGLWESVVKSFKFHLKRVIGTASVTFEELATITSQIEACLNSRPLSGISNDPNDLSALTPGHFLIGKPLTAIPQVPIPDDLHLCDRWRMIQRMIQHFWNRWSNEYLTKLQSRPKWRTLQPDIKVGDLVLIKHENLAPLQWRLGRIVKTFPGGDNRVRVVELKTESGKLLRPISKLCKLPIT